MQIVHMCVLNYFLHTQSPTIHLAIVDESVLLPRSPFLPVFREGGRVRGMRRGTRVR